MGDPLEERVESTKGGHGGGRSLVRTDWGSEYCASPVAIREPGREEGEKRDELGGGGVGRHSAQNGTSDPNYEEQSFGANAVESGRLNGCAKKVE